MTRLFRTATAMAVAAAALGTASAPTATGASGDDTHVRRVLFGAYVDGVADDPARLRRFERLVGRRTRIASRYSGFGAVFPSALDERLAAGGRRKVLISWDPGDTRFSEWADGAHDGYLDGIVAAARDYPYRLYVRPWPEMNGDWSRFQPTASGQAPSGGTPAEFKAAWRHVVRYVRGHGARNVKWVFNPASDTYPATTPVRSIWPGARFVDVLGIDGFNWGRDDAWGRWLGFRRIFAPMYRRLTELHPSAPVWICEFGSKEPRRRDGSPTDTRHSKRQWLYRAFNFRGLPRIQALVYFHVRKERDWRVTSSRPALRGARHALATPRFSPRR